MTTDLGDLIESLKREISPPGTDLFPDATDDEFFGHLQDSFWEAVLDTVISSSTYSQDANGVVTPTLPGALQQVIVIYAGIRIVRNALRNINSLFRAKAGPVEFEQEKSASMLKGILDDLRDRKGLILSNLSEIGTITPKYADMIQDRENAIKYQDTWWVAH